MKRSFLLLPLLYASFAAQAQQAPNAPTSVVLFVPDDAPQANCTPVSSTATFTKTTVRQTYVEEFNELPLLATGDGAKNGRLAPHLDGGMQNGLHAGYDWSSKRRQEVAQEQQTYVDPAFKGLGLQPFSVNNGILSITARRAQDEHTNALWGAAFTSGLLSTHQKYAQQYGYFEIKTKLPTGINQLPAFWMLPIDRTWPPEIDVMENMRDNEISQGSHWKLNGVQGHSGCKTTFPGMDDALHTYGALWTPERIVYYIDRKPIGQIAIKPAQNQPFYMMVNLAIGGNLVGWVAPSDTSFPRTMEVDYIAAYTDIRSACKASVNSDTGVTICK